MGKNKTNSGLGKALIKKHQEKNHKKARGPVGQVSIYLLIIPLASYH